MNASLWQLAGWTMIHSLWLGAAVALAGGFLRLACRRAAPNMRYAISLATLTLLAAAPIAAAAWLSVNGVPQLAAANVSESILLPLPQGEGWGGGQPGYTASHPSLTLPSMGREPQEQQGSPASEVIDLAHATPAELDALAAQTQPAASPTTTQPLAPPIPHSSFPISPPTYSPTHVLTYSLPHLPTLWLIGAPLTFTLLATGLLGSARIRRRATPLTAGPAFDACERLRQTLKITRRVALAVSDSVAQPILVGIVRPLILLPTAALAGWTPEQLDMVLLHELAHVRRWDNLVNLLQRIVESLLFFHPAVWLLSRQVRRDREECCDAAVIRHTDRPHQYAELLVSIAAALRGGPAPSLAVASAMASHPLAGRIRRILNLEEEPMRITRRTLAATLLLPLLLAAAIFYSGASAEDSQNPPPSQEQPSTLARGERAQGSIPEETTATPDAAPSTSPSDTNKPAPENSEDAYTANYPIQPDTRIDLFDLVRSLGGHNLKLDMVANEWVIMLHASKQAHNRLRVLLGDPTLPQPAKPVAQSAQLSWNNTPAAAAAPPLLGSNAAAGQQEIIIHFPPSFPSSDLERERIRKALAADGHQATLTSLKSMSESATGEIEEKSVPCIRVNVPNDWRAMPVWETSYGQVTCRIVNDPSTARLAPPYSGPRHSAPAGGPDSPNQGAAAAGSNAWNAQPTPNASPGAAAPIQEPEPPAISADNKISTLRQEIIRLQTLEVAAKEELGKIETLNGTAINYDAANPFTLEALAAVAICNDPTIATYRRKLATLQQLRERAESAQLKDSPLVERLESTLQEAIQQMLTYQTDAQKSAREQLAKASNETLRTALIEHEKHFAGIAKSLAEHQQQLKAARQQLRDLTTANPEQMSLIDAESEIAQDLERCVEQLQALKKAGAPASPNQGGAATGSNAANAPPTANASTGSAAPVQEPEPPSPFPTLENQKIADRAYKLLGLELEPLSAEDLERVKKLGYSGGLRVATHTIPSRPAQDAFEADDLLVGLHVWPVIDLNSLDEVFQRDDLGELNPLKYYVIRNMHDPATRGLGGGGFGGGPKEDTVVTGRLQIPDAELLSRGLEQTNQAMAELATSPLPASVPNSAPASPATDPTFLYDGKTFDQWRDLWKLELNPERRIEAINALATLGKAGYGAEAADAILDVAGQYDRGGNADSAEGKLVGAIDEAVTHMPADLWMPRVQAKIKDGDEASKKRWRAYARQFLIFSHDKRLEARIWAAKFADDPADGLLNVTAMYLLQSDQNLEDPLTVELVRKALHERVDHKRAYLMLQFRHIDKIPEQLDALVRDHQARQLLQQTMQQDMSEEHAPELVASMLAILNDPNRADDHVGAVRTLRAMYPALRRRSMQAERLQVVEQLTTILRDGPDELLLPAWAALANISGTAAVQIPADYLKEGKISAERAKRLREFDQQELIDESNAD